MTSEQQPQPTLEDLATLACEGTISAADLARLEQLLADDPVAVATFSEYCEFDADLRFFWRSNDALEGALAAIQPVVAPSAAPAIPDLVQPPAESVDDSRFRQVWETVYGVASNYVALSLLISSLVIAIIVLSMGLIVPETAPVAPSREPDITVLAQVTDTADAAWSHKSDANFKNVELFSGERLILNRGLAEVTFNDGAVVVLQGPCEFTIRSAEVGGLNLGKLFARVPKQAIGFTVVTPTATIVDLGTEFGVRVDATGDTMTEVLVGAINVKRRGASPTGSMKLHAGNAATISVAGQAIVAVASEGQFVQQIGSRDGRPTPGAPLDDRPGGVAHVDFNDFRLGPAAGQQGGGGYARGSRWDGATRSIQIVSGDLTAPPETGYQLTQTSTPQALRGFWATTGNRQVHRNLARPMRGDVIWFSFLLQHEQADSSGGLVFNEATPIAVTNYPVMRSDGNDLRIGGKLAANDIFVEGQTALILGRIAVDDEDVDQVEIWVNPNVAAGTTELGEPTASEQCEVVAAEGVMRLGAVTFRNSRLDMVRISDREDGFADVTSSEASNGP